jgi:bacillithiol biosynthesis deacetylase BshB1
MVDVLVFSAHPDDAEFGMGATLVKLKEQGYSIALCTLTNGESGTHGTPEVRKQEMKDAAHILDADIEILEWPDCGIHDAQENRCTLASIIRKHQPTLVFAPYHTNTGSHRDGRTHPDHSATGTLVRIAARFARFANIDGVQGEAHKISALLYYMYGQTISPDVYVDVSEHMQAWKTLANCHKSQTALHQGAVIEHLQEYRSIEGANNKCEYAEGFVSDDALKLDFSTLL